MAKLVYVSGLHAYKLGIPSRAYRGGPINSDAWLVDARRLKRAKRKHG